MDLRDRRPAGDLGQAGAEARPRAARRGRTRGAPGRPGSRRRAGRRTGRARCRPASGRGRTASAISGAAEEEQDEPDDDQADPAGRDVEHRQEDAEEQQRGAEVALDDDDPEGDRPHRDHRGEVRQRRQAERPEARVLLDEQRPVLRQVAGQEDDQDHLEQLGRLAAERPELEGQALAVDLGAEHERQQQQADPGGRPGVLVAAQPAVGADDDRRASSRRPARTSSQTSWTSASPSVVPKNVWVTRSCGSRSISSSEIPPSIATVGSRTWSVRRPARTWASVGGEQRAEVDRAGPARRTAGTARRPSPPARRCRRRGRARRARAAGARASAGAAGSGRGRAGSGRASAWPASSSAVIASARSRRIRTWPICSSSPKPSGATPSTRRPLTYDPFVLPRSSRYQLRPR